MHREKKIDHGFHRAAKWEMWNEQRCQTCSSRNTVRQIVKIRTVCKSVPFTLSLCSGYRFSLSLSFPCHQMMKMRSHLRERFFFVIRRSKPKQKWKNEAKRKKRSKKEAHFFRAELFHLTLPSRRKIVWISFLLPEFKLVSVCLFPHL